MNKRVARCGICGEKMPKKKNRYYFTLGPFGERRSKERFCSAACAETEREHVVEEINAGQVTVGDVMERRKAKPVRLRRRRK